MANPIDAYLSRIRRRLAKRLPATLVDEHVGEIANHLHDSVSSRVAAGETEAVASACALRDVGSDFLVADGLIRAHSGIAKRSVWRLTWINCVLLIVAALLPFSFEYGVQNHYLQAYGIWLPWCFLASFTIVCLRSRRIVLMPIVAAVAFVLVFAFTDLWLVGPYGTYPIAMGRRKAVVREWNHEVMNLTAALELIHDNGRTPYPAALRQGSDYLVASPFVQHTITRDFMNPIGQQHDLLSYRFVPIVGETQARALWRTVSPPQVRVIESNLKSAQLNLAAWEKVNLGVLTALRMFGRIMAAGIPVIAFLFAVNLLALAAVELRRRIVMAAWNRRRFV